MLPFVLTIVAASGLFLLAGATRNQGWYVADQLCLRGPALCDSPGLLWIAIAVVALVLSIRAVVKT